MKKLISMALAAGMAVRPAPSGGGAVGMPRQPIPPLLPPPRRLPTATWPTSRVRAR